MFRPCILFLVLGVMSVAQASNLPKNFVDSTTLPGFHAAVQAAGGKVMFPNAVLKKSAIYLAGEQNHQGGYTLYLNYTEDCGVAAYCNLGHLTVQAATGPLTLYRNQAKELMTQKIILQNGILATYTQGYAMADYWPPHLDWISQGMLYRLTYRDAGQRDLVWMANHMQPFNLSVQSANQKSSALSPVRVSQT